jgi:diguanylate cyclase (GGDEF)-like protein
MSSNSAENGRPSLLPPHVDFLLRSLEAAIAHAAWMEEEANLDSLTGLSNRRALEEQYQRLQQGELEERRRNSTKTNQPTAIIMADVDRFKSVNDTYGHDAGDFVLRGVAATIDASLRQRDIVARLGGEEFVAVLPRTTEEYALRKAEALRRGIKAGNLLQAQGLDTEQGLTVSIGVAMVDFEDPLEANLKRADLALYAAKDLGRDRVIAYSALGQMPGFQGVEIGVAVPHEE